MSSSVCTGMYAVVLDTTLRHEFVSMYRHVCSSTWHNFTTTYMPVRTDKLDDVKLCQVLLHACLYVLTNSWRKVVSSTTTYMPVRTDKLDDVKLCQVLLHTCLYASTYRHVCSSIWRNFTSSSLSVRTCMYVVVLDTTLRHEFVSTYRHVCSSTWYNFTSWVRQYVQACM
jgi:hypothetical protein